MAQKRYRLLHWEKTCWMNYAKMYCTKLPIHQNLRNKIGSSINHLTYEASNVACSNVRAQTCREFLLVDFNEMNVGANKHNGQSQESPIMDKTNINGLDTEDSNRNRGILKPRVCSTQGRFEQSSNPSIHLQGFSLNKLKSDSQSTKKIDQPSMCTIQHNTQVLSTSSVQPCRCGSTSHTCTTHPECSLHRISPLKQTKVQSRGSEKKICSYVHLDSNRKLALLTSARQLQHDLKTWEPLIDCNTDVYGPAFSQVYSSDCFDSTCLITAATNPRVDLATDSDHLLNDESIVNEYESGQENHLMNWSHIVDQYTSPNELGSLDDKFWKSAQIV